MTKPYLLFKRLMDILVASIVLILFSPIILLSLLIQWIEIGSSPVFIQTRPGKNEVPFNIIKLKTMNEKRDSKGNLLPDKDRITRFGRFFRSASIDELPQLINVLKGDMSFVGPRPLLLEYLKLYNEEQRRRHDVRPGITGLAQVNGRNAISWQEKFDYDINYAKDLSFSLDLIILLKTVKKVLNSSDIQSDGQVTMPKFTGNENIRS
ncbi:sugar transferase [Schleiferiaceae bacterium]|nr:sugar transferase [Schleiferiaceae bacterium]